MGVMCKAAIIGYKVSDQCAGGRDSGEKGKTRRGR
jgi:hypothetical protein